MLRPVFALGLLASLPALAALSCSSDRSREGEDVTYIGQSIMGGVDDTSDPAVVGIVIMQGYNAGICTGTLIAPNLVLTARHCVAPTGDQISCSTSSFGSTYSASAFHVTTEWRGPEDLMSTYKMEGNWYDASRVIVSDRTKVCGNDVALIQLQGAGIPSYVATPIVPRVDLNVSKQEQYTAIGYGATDDYGSNSGRRRILENLFVNCVNSCFASVMDLEYEWEGDRGICQGDSGGPALDSAGRVVGVVSRGALGCTMPIYASVSAWGDWIKQNAVAAAQAGGYDPAPWALGEPTGPDIGTGGTGGSGGTGVDPGGAGLGQACQDHVDCASDLCVLENNLTMYCSEPCSEQDPACPDGFVCAPSLGACFQPGGFGASCDEGCRSDMCVQDSNGMYCSQACSTDADCPDPATCDEEQGACFLPMKTSAYNASGSSDGCSIALRDDPTKPIPWAVGFGLALIGLARRRRRAG